MDSAAAPGPPAGADRRFAHNFGALVVCKLGGDLVVFLFFVGLSRLFGEPAVGLYAFALGICGAVAALADFGLYDYSVRELSRGRAAIQRLLPLLLSLRFLLSVLSLALLPALAWIAGLHGEAAGVLLVVGAHQVLITFAAGIAAIFAAEERMVMTAGLEAGARVAGAALGLGLALAGADLVVALAGMTFAAGLQCLVLFLILRRRFAWQQRWSSATAAIATLRLSSPFLLSDLARRLSIRIDIIMLGLMLGTASVGAYGAASRVVALLLFLPHFAGMALLPRIARLHAIDEAQLRLLFRDAMRLAVLAGIPAAAGLWLIADELVRLVFGAEFAEAAPLLRLLAALVAIEALRSLLAVFLTGCDLQGWRTGAEWVALALAVPLQLAGIQLAGPAGSAVALLASEALLLVAFAWRLRPLLGWPPVAGRVLLAGSASLLFVVLLELVVELALPLTVIAAMAIYAGCLLASGPVRRGELQQLSQLLR